jgi:iron complex transport system permease protein
MLDSKSSEGISEGYLNYSRRKYLFLIACLIAILVLIVVTIRLGSADLSYWDILNYLIHPDDSWNSAVVWDLRLRVILAAVIAGAALGLSGAVMQTILRNPMASPFTLGVSNAAAFGAAFAILFLNGGTVSMVSGGIEVSSPVVVTLCAFTFAMLCTLVMLIVVKVTDVSPETIVLAGMAMSSVFTALLSFMQYMADSTTLTAIVGWQFGSVSRISWNQEIALLIVVALAAIYYIFKRWDYNALESGEDVARGLGVNISRTRLVGLTVSAVLTAVVVSFMGIIGFIGLIAPHIVKKFVGTDNRFVIPGSIVIGGLVMIIAYIISSYAFGTVLPIGIITSAVGGPMFIAILIGRRHRR